MRPMDPRHAVWSGQDAVFQESKRSEAPGARPSECESRRRWCGHRAGLKEGSVRSKMAAKRRTALQIHAEQLELLERYLLLRPLDGHIGLELDERSRVDNLAFLRALCLVRDLTSSSQRMYATSSASTSPPRTRRKEPNLPLVMAHHCTFVLTPPPQPSAERFWSNARVDQDSKA